MTTFTINQQQIDFSSDALGVIAEHLPLKDQANFAITAKIFNQAIQDVPELRNQKKNYRKLINKIKTKTTISMNQTIFNFGNKKPSMIKASIKKGELSFENSKLSDFVASYDSDSDSESSDKEIEVNEVNCQINLDWRYARGYGLPLSKQTGIVAFFKNLVSVPKTTWRDINGYDGPEYKEYVLDSVYIIHNAELKVSDKRMLKLAEKNFNNYLRNINR